MVKKTAEDPPAPTKVARNRLRADRVIQFLERLTVPSGVGQGRPFKLRRFQVKFVRDVYEPCVSARVRRRIVRRAILSIARKNGKTALLAGLVLCHLFGPEAVANGEVYSAANSREQAAQIFKVAKQMVEADPEIQSIVRVIDSTKTIVCYSNGSFYRAISAEAKLQHGLNPSFAVYDELAQSTSRDLYDVLDTSMGARLEPLFVVISTQSNDPEHVLSLLIDDGLSGEDPTTVCHLYAVPDGDDVDIYDESLWSLANPALGDFRSMDDLRSLAGKAARMPSEEPKFRNLYLNQRCSATSPLIARVEWLACAGDASFHPKEEVYLALDLSSVGDLSALAMVSVKEKSRLRVWMWKPGGMLEPHSNRDFGHGNHRYVQWEKQGFLEKTEGRTIDHKAIAIKIAELCKTYNVLGMAYDRHKIDYLIRQFDAIDFAAYQDSERENKKNPDGLRLIPWGQGFVSMAPAVDAFEAAVLNRDLVHDSNPCLTWNIANAVVVMDPAGNRKLDKDKARFRIDGAQATAMVVGLKYREVMEDDGDFDDFLSGAVMR